MIDLFPKSFLLIGAGKMGEALYLSWIDSDVPAEQITVVDPASPIEGALHSVDDVQKTPDCVMLAVKPQSLDEVLPQVQKKWGSTPLYISIAAGKPLSYFEKHLGENAPVIRVMPNTPAIIGQGISVMIANAHVTKEQKLSAAAVMHASGSVMWLAADQENLMNAVTAISGSGPAYLFLFLECLINAGKAQGLPEQVASALALETILGSATLALLSRETLSELRTNVTSKGGTTEAALSVMMKDDKLQTLITEAITAAVKRGQELA